MEKLKLKQGAKLDIAFAGVSESGDHEFEMKSSFEKNLNEAAFLISVPMKNGEKIEIGEFDKIIIQYKISSKPYIVEGYVDETVKQGIRTYWKVRRVSESREFFTRADVRIKSNIPLQITKTWWTPEGNEKQESSTALTMDISNNGAALFVNLPFNVGEITGTVFQPKGKKRELAQNAEVCWVRDNPDKGLPFRKLVGIRFVFMNDKERKTMQNYVENVMAETSETETM